MRKWILALAALALAVPALAQTPDQATADFAIRYNVASATKTYCAVTGGTGGDPFGQATRVSTTVETSGSSVTITAVTVASGPFTNVSVGDTLYFDVSGTTLRRTVVTNADNDTVTVDAAIDLSAGAGYKFSYKSIACGTSSTDGWISVEGFSTALMTVSYLAGDLDTLDVSFECRDNTPDGNIVQVYPGPSSACGFGTLATDVCTFATPAAIPGAGIAFQIETNPFQACRVALKYGSSGTTSSVNASLTLWRMH